MSSENPKIIQESGLTRFFAQVREHIQRGLLGVHLAVTNPVGSVEDTSKERHQAITAMEPEQTIIFNPPQSAGIDQYNREWPMESMHHINELPVSRTNLNFPKATIQPPERNPQDFQPTLDPRRDSIIFEDPK